MLVGGDNEGCRPFGVFFLGHVSPDQALAMMVLR